MELAHGGQLAVLGMEELERAAAAGKDDGEFLEGLRRRKRAFGRLDVVGQRVDAPVVEAERPQLDAAGGRVEARLAVGAQHAFGVLVVRGVPFPVRGAVAAIAVAFLHVAGGVLNRLLPGAVVLGAVGVQLVVQVPRAPFLVVGPRPVLGLDALAQLEADLLVRLGLVVVGHLHHGAHGRPPRAAAVALAAHGHGQHDVGHGLRRGRHERVGHHDERHLHERGARAGGVHGGAGQRVGAFGSRTSGWGRARPSRWQPGWRRCRRTTLCWTR